VPVPLLVLGVGFGFSLAANLLWCWPGGTVRILGGALASVALPAAVHMWPHVPATTWATSALRNAVMAGIAVLAAVTTFAHAASLLIAHGEDPRLACAYPVMTELLVVFAVLARRTPAPARRTNRVNPARRRGTDARPAPTTAPAPAPRNELASRRADRAAISSWLRDQPERRFTDEVDAMRATFGIGRTLAKSIRTEVRSAVAS
jgi:hypothetical protein